MLSMWKETGPCQGCDSRWVESMRKDSLKCHKQSFVQTMARGFMEKLLFPDSQTFMNIPRMFMVGQALAKIGEEVLCYEMSTGVSASRQAIFALELSRVVTSNSLIHLT